MGKTLVIVESPAKANTIGRYLGQNYKVTASVGHIRDLPASTLGVDVNRDFKPRYITMRGKEKVVKEIKKLKEDADQVLLATDPDREGEAIAWHLANALKIDETTPCRISFNEITKNSVQSALENPHQIDMNLVNAQQARRILDRLVGYELSPLLWKKIRKGLSAGRVQSVTTKIIVDREREIKAFEPEEYWLLTAFLKKAEKDPAFRVRYYGDKISGKVKKIPLAKEADVKALLNDLKTASYLVEKVNKKEAKRHAKPPYTTSTLQQEASRKLGFSSARTMRVAQQLYEGVDLKGHGSTALITYLRTDSVRISPEAAAAARETILKEHGQEFLPKKANYYKNKKDAQNAHECIRPAHFELSPFVIKDQLSNEQFRLYQLIWNKFIASQMVPAIFDTVSAEINAKQHIFRARGETLKFPGWMKQYGFDFEENSENNEDDLNKENLPVLAEGDTLILDKLEPEQKFTTPPARYTEASLIRVLEELGIGRPSTYAPTVSTILNRKYVEKDGRSLYPTELGFLVTEMLEENFATIVDTDFTAAMEERLDAVEEGEKDWVEVLKDFYPAFHEAVDRAEENIEKVEIPDVPIHEKCPKCGDGDLVIKHGRYGKFIACNRYPDCDYSRAIEVKVDGVCPKCGSGILEKTTKKRRSSKFYVCDKTNDPDCDFISWDIPLAKKCPVCQAYMVKKRYRGKFYEKCSNPDCQTNQKTTGKKTVKTVKKKKSTVSKNNMTQTEKTGSKG